MGADWNRIARAAIVAKFQELTWRDDGERCRGTTHAENTLPRISIAFGALLIVLGLFAYFAMQDPGSRSVTALIPAFFGLPLVILGAIAQAKPATRKHTMHAAAAIGTLGLLGTVPGVIKAVKWMGGTEPARPAAVQVQVIMCVMCVLFVALCIRSFIEARKARQAGFPMD
jgi:hypothetical protein